MNEPVQTPPPENTRHRDGHSRPTSKHHLQTAFLITVAVLLPLATGYLHAGFMVAAFGSMGIMVLAASKVFRAQAGLFPSLVCLLLMIMHNIWHWADLYFIALYTGNIMNDRALFQRGVVEAMTVLAALWTYRRLMKILKMRITQDWYVKKSLLAFLDGIFFLQVFLLLFWLSGFLLSRFGRGSHFGAQQATMLAALFAALLTGVLFAGYFVRKKNTRKKHRHHHH